MEKKFSRRTWVYVDDLPNQTEMRKRIRAALNYSGIPGITAGERLNMSRSDFQRLIGRKGGDRRAITWTDVWRFAALCEDSLPPEFFTADFDRLREIVPAGMPPFKRPEGAAPPAPPGQPRRPREVPPTSADTATGPSQSGGADSP
jgi:hypothetical protein